MTNILATFNQKIKAAYCLFEYQTPFFLYSLALYFMIIIHNIISIVSAMLKHRTKYWRKKSKKDTHFVQRIQSKVGSAGLYKYGVEGIGCCQQTTRPAPSCCPSKGRWLEWPYLFLSYFVILMVSWCIFANLISICFVNLYAFVIRIRLVHNTMSIRARWI